MAVIAKFMEESIADRSMAAVKEAVEKAMELHMDSSVWSEWPDVLKDGRCKCY